MPRKNRYYSRIKRPKNYRPQFSDYEKLKARWIAENPASTPEQYAEAMRKIAWRCGI